MSIQVHRLNYPEYLLPLLRRERKILSLTFYQLPELHQLKSDPNYTLPERKEILKRVFEDFKSRGLDVSYEEFVATNELEDLMIEDMDETKIQEQSKIWTFKCLNSRIIALDNIITHIVKTNPPNTTPQSTLGYYCFDSTNQVRNKDENIRLQHLNNEIKIEEEEKEENYDNLSDIEIDILEEKEDDEKENKQEEEEEEEIVAIGNKRKRQYQKTWFKSTIIMDDPKIRRNIVCYKENNYWNSIAETIKHKHIHSILWRKDITDILSNFNNNGTQIDGIIAVRINKEQARLSFKNYVLHEGKFRDILIHKNSLLFYDDLINKEKVMADIVITEKKWKILKIFSNYPKADLEWLKPMENQQPRPQIPMNFTPIQWN